MKTGVTERRGFPPVSQAMAPARQEQCRRSGQI